MNIFFATRSVDAKFPQRVYAKLDYSEPEVPADMEPLTAFFDAVDADWFDGIPPQKLIDERFYDSAPISTLETTFQGRSHMEALGSPPPEDGDSWVEIAITDEPQDQLFLQYMTLFDVEPRKRYLAKPMQPPRQDIVRRLKRQFSLDDVPDADPVMIEDLIDCVHGAFAAVYDVGQGNWNALCTDNGAPSLYFDFGGGVQKHAPTFPSSLTGFCSTQNPPIVLSHWDHDHWSSGVRFPESQGLDWIVPRQGLGVSHRAFAQQILQSGRLLIWPSGVPRLGSSQVSIEKCTQSGRNHSGLALIFYEQANHSGQAMLLTGDARYSAIPSGTTRSYTAVVVPHHGADMNNRFAAARSGQPHDRLAYSYGDPNQWSHPVLSTLQGHQGKGWNHPAPVGTNGPVQALYTPHRGPSGAAGHIALHWRHVNTPTQPPCSGGSCKLQIRQW